MSDSHKDKRIKTMADIGELMRLAKALGNARKSNDVGLISKAKQAHDAYRDICLEANEIRTGLTKGDLP